MPPIAAPGMPADYLMLQHYRTNLAAELPRSDTAEPARSRRLPGCGEHNVKFSTYRFMRQNTTEWNELVHYEPPIEGVFRRVA
jgi:hypothetical protein